MLTHRRNYPKKRQGLCVFNDWRQLHGTLRIRERLIRYVRYPTVFQEHIDKVLEFKTPGWLDDIICVTNGTPEEHERELRDILSKLQEAG